MRLGDLDKTWYRVTFCYTNKCLWSEKLTTFSDIPNHQVVQLARKEVILLALQGKLHDEYYA